MQSITYGIIVAGGSGTRFGSQLPKQFLPLAGKPVLMHTIEKFAATIPGIEVIVVLPQSQQEFWLSLCAENRFEIAHRVVAGGDSRYASVQHGVDSIHGDNAISRQKHAVVAFYAKRNTFHVGPADGRNIIELNDEPVFNHVQMRNYDVITVGNTKLMLVGLCGDQFSWTDGVKHG